MKKFEKKQKRNKIKIFFIISLSEVIKLNKSIKYYFLKASTVQNGIVSEKIILLKPEISSISLISFFENLFSNLVPNLSKASVLIS